MADTHGWGTPSDAYRAPTPIVTPLPSRRTLRAAHPDAVDPRSVRRPEQGARRTPPPVRPVASPTTGATSTPVAPRRRTGARVIFSAAVMTLAAGLVATLALPSYAFDPTHGRSGLQAQGRDTTANGQQQLPSVGAGVQAVKVTRDAVTATSEAELKRAAIAKQYAAYTGPTAAQLASMPVPSGAGLSAVITDAEQYIGVPYVFGGADPSGFDCSGYVMYVYAHFGVSLPHSVHQQDEIGTHITEAEAKPGDIVVFNDDSHDGFYLGDGMILHAPYPGARVRIQPLWSTDIHFIRFAIK